MQKLPPQELEAIAVDTRAKLERAIKNVGEDTGAAIDAVETWFATRGNVPEPTATDAAVLRLLNEAPKPMLLAATILLVVNDGNRELKNLTRLFTAMDKMTVEEYIIAICEIATRCADRLARRADSTDQNHPNGDRLH